MKRVLSIIHYPVFGGPHNRNIKLASALRDRGYDTLVLIPDEPGNALARLQGACVPVVARPLARLRATRDPRMHASFLFRFWRDVVMIRRLIREEHIDLVQINGLANAQGAVAGRLERIPVVWQILDTHTPVLLRAALAPALRVLAQVVMCTGEKVSAGHPGVRGFGGNLVHFNPPVDLGTFAWSPEKRRRARSALGLPPDVPVIGTVGNLNLQKGHLTFVEAAGAVRRSRPEVRFVILGAAHRNHEEHVRQVREAIRRVGFCEGEDFLIRDPGDAVADLIAAFDLFWMTSEPDSEGLPTVIEEAMATGLPVISTDVGSISELVADGRTGFLVPAHGAAAIAARTLELIAEHDLAAAMSCAARGAAGLFSVQHCADVHVTAYEKALSAAGRPMPGRT